MLFLFGYALLFALVEIEIEGPHGWAERLPTWFRVTTPAARLYGLFMRGKPLTGYHAVMFVLPLWSFHLGFFARRLLELGGRGGDAGRLPGLGRDLGSALVLLNPRFGWARFRKGEVWWHGRTWIGRFPIDYWGALALSIAVAASAHLGSYEHGVLARHAVLLAGFAALTLACGLAAPALHALVPAHAPARRRRARALSCHRRAMQARRPSRPRR